MRNDWTLAAAVILGSRSNHVRVNQKNQVIDRLALSCLLLRQTNAPFFLECQRHLTKLQRIQRQFLFHAGRRDKR